MSIKIEHYDAKGNLIPGQRGAISLADGGTGSNLAASGPGAVVQTSTGGNFAVESALDETRGGTGQTTITTGDLIYGSSSNTLAKLAIGTAGYILKVVAGLPAWALAVYQTIKKAGSAVTQRSNLNFIDGSNVTITVADNSGTDATDVTVATPIVGSPFVVDEQSAPSAPSSGYQSIYGSSTDHNLHRVSSYGMDNVLENTIQHGYTHIETSSETSMAEVTVKANSMGSNGRVRQRIIGLIKNNKGTNGTYTIKVTFGSKTLTIINGTTIGDSATARHAVDVDVEVRNLGATNSQEIYVRTSNGNLAAGTSTAVTTFQTFDTASIDTTADAVLKTTITLSATNAAFFSNSSGFTQGPYKV